jgi:glycosyltransferase involved in cell wall biosynthesis
MPEVSVIVPVYNVEKYLVKCLDSIFSQSYQDYEVIVVDDGSNDGSSRICDKYVLQDRRMKVIHQNNMGLSAARNTGLSLATGKYIMFLDSDDYVYENCLANLMNFGNHEPDFVIGTIVWENENGERNYQKKRNSVLYNKNDFLTEIPSLLQERRLNYVHAKLYKKSILESNGIIFEDDMLTSAEDTVFNFTYLPLCTNVFISGEVSHHYVNHGNGLSQKFYMDRYERAQRLSDFIEKTCQELGIYDTSYPVICERRMYACKWFIDSVLQQEDFSNDVLVKLLNKPYNDRKLRNAVAYVDLNEFDNICKLIKKGSKRVVFEYKSYMFLKKIAPAILKFTPKPIHNIYSRVKQRIQNSIR